ncbi:glycerate kinase [Salipaludibacillus sp. HK11]|uniref:glycerate kinase n=1 Tax=Salipaludibacillus sp. HK11 TaxID=3394320 RepID=UPI0039FBD933
MNIVIAPDSYKGSLSSIHVGEIINKGITQAIPCVKTTVFPMADGGEGTMDAFLYRLKGDIHKITAKDPLLRNRQAEMAIVKEENLAIIESAAMIGLPLLTADEKNPMNTSSYGLGQAILYGLNQGVRKFIIGLGGSATNDAGLGMLEALGAEFLLSRNKQINQATVKDMQSILEVKLASLDHRLKDTTIIIASDVDNPLCGPRGASVVFGPQKGATQEMALKLDHSLEYFASLFAHGEHLKNSEGSGAAGGLGFGLLLLGAELQSGAEIIADSLQIEKSIQNCDVLITGEGKTDEQTIHGKAPVYLAKIAKKYNKPVIIISGSLAENYQTLSPYFDAFFSIIERPVMVDEAMVNTEKWLEQTSYYVGCLLAINLRKDIKK